jgi:H+/Cl- antiporter ClcA
MLNFSFEVRIILGVVAALASIIAGVLGNTLSINIVYIFQRRGRKPNPQPISVWITFFLSSFIGVVFGGLAVFSTETINQTITDSSRMVFLSIAGIALFIFLILSIYLEGNIRYNIYRVTSSWCKTQERS